MRCTDSNGALLWLNNANNRELLHIDSRLKEWTMCSNVDDLYTTARNIGSDWIYPQLFEANIKVLVYGGDTDAMVSVLGS